MEFYDLDIDDDRVEFIEAKTGGWAGHIPVRTLYEALEKHNVPKEMWPAPPKDARCLERGMTDLRSQRHLVRPLKKGRGYALVIEDADALDLEKPTDGEESERSSGKVEITAKVDRSETDGHVSTLRITPADHPAAPMILESFKHHRGTGENGDLGLFQCSQDLSIWFSRHIIPWVRGLSNKNRGGSYFVLKGESSRRILAVSKALQEVSQYKVEFIMKLPNGKNLERTTVMQGGRIIVTPQLTTAGNVEQLVSTILDQCDALCDDAHDSLTKSTKGIKALTTQEKGLDKMSEALKEVEAVLGHSLTAATERLNEATAASGMMKLKLEAEKDKKERAA